VGCITPDGKPVTQDWFQIARGSDAYILRGVFQAPQGNSFVVGDVMIGGVAVAFGGQIAKLIDMGLTGVAMARARSRIRPFPALAPLPYRRRVRPLEVLRGDCSRDFG